MAGPPLVTGATGFAGSHLVDHLLDTRAGCRRVGEPARRDLQRPAIRRSRGTRSTCSTARRFATPIAALQPSVVYHCAGAADVGDVVGAIPSRLCKVNALGTHHLLEARATRRLDARSSSLSGRRRFIVPRADAD